MKTVAIAGAGFSGLTLAHALLDLGLPVEIWESQPQPGGLIATHNTRFGLVETAANAILSNADLEDLFHRLGVPFAKQSPVSRRRYIYRGRPRRWPLGLRSSLRLARLGVAQLFWRQEHWPHAHETVSEWARRTVGVEFEESLLAPALQGVYAGDVRRMSATLVLRRLFADVRPARGKWRGSVSPAQGMGQLMEALKASILSRGGNLRLHQSFVYPERVESPTVLCTSAWSAAAILQGPHPAIATTLAQCESLPLLSVTAFFPPQASDLAGFGCLFPRDQGFKALGVLFANSIFSDRSCERCETWIFGGTGNAELLNEDARKLVLDDRRRLLGRDSAEPLAMEVSRWPRAIPHYTVDWEGHLEKLRAQVQPPLYLHGNYLGNIGLAQIHQRSLALAKEIKAAYG